MIALSTHSQKTFLLDIDFLSFWMKDFEWTPCRYFLIFLFFFPVVTFCSTKKNWFGIFCTVVITIFKDFFSNVLFTCQKGAKKKEENILVGRREVQRGPIHFYAPVGECWEPPHNQATWLKIRVNTLLEFLR